MKTIENLAIFLIGYSYSFLVYNKIAFGLALSLGILLLLTINLKLVLNQSKRFITKIRQFDLAIATLFIISLSISSYSSIRGERSLAVVIYLFLFIFFSILIYSLLREKKEYLKSIFKNLSISIFLNSLVILIYNLVNYDDYELIKFKGTMNIISLLTIMNFYFYKSKLNYLSLFLLIPNIFFTGSSASSLGLLGGTLICSIFLIQRKFLKKNFYKLSFSIVFIGFITPLLIFYSKQLPQKFDNVSIEKFEHKIPLNIIDIHRQFIWGFSIEKIKDKFFFGYGPDTSNYIEGSQREIGLNTDTYSTGDMNFIPSHPHNFLIELMLEIGVIGSILFILLLILINTHILKINNSLQSKIFLIFFNSYFWVSSLVNFSFWLGWWQGSYYLLLSLIASQAYKKKLYSNE